MWHVPTLMPLDINISISFSIAICRNNTKDLNQKKIFLKSCLDPLGEHKWGQLASAHHKSFPQVSTSTLAYALRLSLHPSVIIKDPRKTVRVYHNA